MTAARVAEATVEVLATSTAERRVAQATVEVLAAATSHRRTAAVVVEVLRVSRLEAPGNLGDTIGSQKSSFGTAQGAQAQLAASIEPATRIPFAASPHPLTVRALPIEGTWGAGLPNAFLIAPIEYVEHMSAQGFNGTVFGAADAEVSTTVSAIGEQFFNAGVPTAHISFSAGAIVAATQFGGVSNRRGARSTGTNSTVFGQGHTTAVFLARALRPTTRFGRRHTLRTAGKKHRTFGRRSTRFGRPRGAQFFGNQAEGGIHAVVGTARGFSFMRARHIPPRTSFGTPTVRRGAVC